MYTILNETEINTALSKTKSDLINSETQSKLQRIRCIGRADLSQSHGKRRVA